MRILVSRAGQQLGPFSIDELRAELAAGRVAPSDLAWWDGEPAWAQVSQVPGIRQAPAQSPQPAMPPPAYPNTAPVYFPGPVGDDGAGLATASLVCGIVSFFGGMCFTGIPAIFCGHMALSRQKKAGVSGSRGLAIAGLILGYGTTVVSIVMAIVAVVFLSASIPIIKAAAKQAQTTQYSVNSEDTSWAHVDTLVEACADYAEAHNGEYPPALSVLVPEYLPDFTHLEDPLAPQFGSGGYYYIRPAKDAPDSTVVIASHGVTKDGKRVIGLKDGTVTSEHWNPPADL